MKQTMKEHASIIRVLTIGIIVLFCCLFFRPAILEADTGKKIEYVDSIREDEEGKKISFPTNVFVDPVMDEIYITDSKGRIIIYTSDFFPLFTIDQRRGIESPLSLTVDKDGNLYVLQAASKSNPKNRISIFNACLKWKRDIYLEDVERAKNFVPSRITVDKKGNIYLVSIGDTGVIVLNNQGEIKKILSPGEEDKGVLVTDITIDKNGRIYLVSSTEGRVYVYDENGSFLFEFGEKGGSTGKLSQPIAVGVDNERERIYVVDYMRHTISAYDSKDGKYLFEFGGLGWGEGWFQHPKDIAIETNGRILVADTFNDRIEILKPKE